MGSYDSEYDFFICHASEDKDTLVRPLSVALSSAGYKVWYDEKILVLGSNLRQSIDRGLSKAKRGIIVLSKAFFEKQWSQWELDGLLQRHLSKGNLLLPIWHGVSSDDVRRFSPSLANLVAVSTSYGLGAVLEQILDAVTPTSKRGSGRRLPEIVSTESRREVVLEFDRFDDACIEFERLLNSESDDEMRSFMLKNPRFLSWLLRRRIPAILKTNVLLDDQYISDALSMCSPQWIEASLLGIGPISKPPFREDGSWTMDFADAVGRIMGQRAWQAKNEDAFAQIMEDMVAASEAEWPIKSGFYSFARLISTCQKRLFQVTTILLFGRHRMVNEDSWRLIHNSLPSVQLISYDAILRGLYDRCPTVELISPMILHSQTIHDGETGEFILERFPLSQISATLNANIPDGLTDEPDIEMISFDVRAWIRIQNSPDRLQRPPDSIIDASSQMPIALNVHYNDDFWSDKSWTSLEWWSATIFPTGFGDRLLFKFAVTSVKPYDTLEIGVSSIRYRYRGCRLEDKLW